MTIQETMSVAQNALAQLKEYLAQQHTRREELKAIITAATEELKAINGELDTFNATGQEIKSLTTKTRKRRESKAPVAVDSEGKPVVKVRRKKGETDEQYNARKEAAQAVTE